MTTRLSPRDDGGGIGVEAPVLGIPESRPLPSRRRALTALILLLAALVPTVWGQMHLMQDRSIGWWGALIGIVMAAAAARIGETAPASLATPPKDPRFARMRWMLIPAILLGVFAMWAKTATEIGEGLILAAWWLALGCLLVPTLVPERRSSPRPLDAAVTRIRDNAVELAVVALLLAAALALRLPYLERFPAAVHNDEANCGLMGHQVLEWRKDGEPIWFRTCPDFYHFPAIGFLPSAAGQALTGANLYGHRLANVVLSMLTLGCFYGLARSMLGRGPAALALGLAAGGHMAVHWSRSGIHSGHAAWLTVMCALLVWKAVATGKLRFFVLSGFALASCLLTYNAAFLVPLWVAIVLAAIWLARPVFRRRHTTSLLLALISAAVFLAPFAGEHLKHPETFFGRSSMMVWTSDPTSVTHMRANEETQFRVAAVERNWLRAKQLLHTAGDSNLQYGNKGIGIIDAATGVLFVLGLGTALARPFHHRHGPLLLLLVLTFLLGGLFAIDGVQYSRIAGLAVMIMAFPALWARQVLSASRVAVQSWGAPLSGLLLAAAMIAIGLVNFRYTFKEHDRISWLEGPMRRTAVMTALTRNLRDWGERNFTFVHTSIDFDPNHRSVRFIAPDCTVAVFDSVEGLDLSLARGFDTITFAVAAASKKQIAELREAFPGGEEPEAAIEFHDPGDVAMLYRIRTPSRTEQPQ